MIDYLVQATLRQALQQLRANPQALLDVLPILAHIDPRRFAAARDFFASTDVPVLLLYPQQPPPHPAFVVVRLEDATLDGQFLSSYIGEDLETTPSGQPVSLTALSGAELLSSLAIDCVAIDNVDLCVWLAQVCLWAALFFRDALADLGLLFQGARLADVDPNQRVAPDVAFVRTLTLSYRHVVGFTTTYAHLIRRINVVADDPRDPAHPFLP